MSQDIVSATMAHLLTCQHGSRFTFSHEFHDMLIGQMLNTLEGKDPGDFVLRRRNRGPNGEVLMWPDYSMNDYIYRPDCLDDVCFYQFSECYERIALSFHRMSKEDQHRMPILKEGEYCFRDDHPGQRYCCIKKAKKKKVPKISMPKGMICDLEDLQLSEENLSEEALQNRENYAKVALILFFPFRDNSIFSLEEDGCLWEK